MVHRLLDLGFENEKAAMEEGDNNERLFEYNHIADNCNVMRVKAKRAQDDSDSIYLAAYLENNPIYVDAVVVGTGPRSFSVHIEIFGNVKRLCSDEMHLISPLFNETTRMLTLFVDPTKEDRCKCFEHPDILQFERIDLTIAAPVVIYVSKNDSCSLAVRYSLVCAGTCADNGLQHANFETVVVTPMNGNSLPYVDDVTSSLNWQIQSGGW